MSCYGSPGQPPAKMDLFSLGSAMRWQKGSKQFKTSTETLHLLSMETVLNVECEWGRNMLSEIPWK